MKAFVSPLGPSILAFLALKRAMGRHYQANEGELSRFDRYIATLDPPVQSVTREVVHGWLAAQPNLAPRTLCGKASILRQFCRYLARLDPCTYIPERTFLPVTLPLFRPHIYSEEEVRALVRMALASSAHGWKLRPQMLSTVLLVLYATGLRRAEVCRLRLEDIDLEANTLFVRRTKFFKSRLVPFSCDLERQLRTYLTLRASQSPTDRDAPLFLNRSRRALRPAKLSGIFHGLVEAAGIAAAPGRRTPRLHDMRHTYAVHRLLRWYREGVNVEAKLPLLATYMGHGNPLSTLTYLHATAELLREASQRFEHAYGNLISDRMEMSHALE